MPAFFSVINSYGLLTNIITIAVMYAINPSSNPTSILCVLIKYHT